MSSNLAAPLKIATTLAGTAVEAQATTAQARFAEQQAAATAAHARQQEAALRRTAARTSAALRGRFAAAGVAPTGSPLEALEEKAREDELEARMIRYQGAVDAASDQMRARQLRAQRTLGLIDAAGSIGQSLIGSGETPVEGASTSRTRRIHP